MPGDLSMLPKRDWLDMTWQDIARGEPASWVAVLPLAAVEQHGPHLPLGTDALIMQAYLARVRQRLPVDLPVSFLPLQSIGHSDEHRAFPGTLTLSAETLLRVLAEIGASIHRAGLRKLVLINSHGGNSSVLELAARALRVEHRMLAVVTSWSRLGYPEGLFEPHEIEHGIHGGAIESAIMNAAFPLLVRMERADDFPSRAARYPAEFAQLRLVRPAALGWMAQDLNPEGAVGNAAAASAAQGVAALDHGAAAFVQLLDDVHRFDLAHLRESSL